MKKILALLLILVVASVGLFADDPAPVVTPGDATIIITTTKSGVVLFGVSAAPLASSAFASKTAFSGSGVNTSLEKEIDIENLIEEDGIIVGYFSGFNSTKNAVSVSVTVSPLTNGALGSESVSITLVASNPLEDEEIIIPAATNEREILENTPITVKANSSEIDLAPEGNYTATITFTVVAGS